MKKLLDSFMDIDYNRCNDKNKGWNSPMEQTQKKNRVAAVNIVFLISILITVVAAFLPLDFLSGCPAGQLMFSQIILALPAVLYLVFHKLPYAETVRFKKMKLADMAWCILFGILLQPVLTLLNAISLVFSTNVTNNFIFELSRQVPFLGALLLTAVVPCVLEETVYRGVFYNEYSKINPWKAALLSGVLFGLMHGNVNQFCYAAVMGILFALVVEATGSILSTMLIHFWINAGSVVMMYLYPKLYEVMQAFYRMYKEYGNEEMAVQLELAFGDMTLAPAEWMQQLMLSTEQVVLTVPDVLLLYGPQALVMSVLAFFVYKKLAVNNGNWQRICGWFKPQTEQEEEPQQRILTVPLVLAIVIGVVFMIAYEILIRM